MLSRRHWIVYLFLASSQTQQRQNGDYLRGGVDAFAPIISRQRARPSAFAFHARKENDKASQEDAKEEETGIYEVIRDAFRNLAKLR